ncbi:MAG: nitrous oxide reductase family maturation protein NosD [Candidatus Thorarchaeota archaeon]
MRNQERVSWVALSCIIFLLIVAPKQSSVSFSSGVFITSFHVALIQHDPIVINGDANFTETASAEGWSGDGSSDNPFIIDNLDIDRGGTSGACINISNTLVHFTIQNCDLAGASAQAGIYLNNVSHGFLSNNTSTSNRYGIYLLSSGNNTIANNTCTGNNDGGIFMYDSDFNTVSDNDCDNNANFGIFIRFCDSSLLSKNSCSSTGAYGILIRESTSNLIENNTCKQNGEGIRVWYSSNGNTLIRNVCDFNANYGILIDNAHYAFPSYVTDNFCSDNDYGIYASGSFLNIANNTLIDNLINGIQAECSDSVVTDNYVRGSDEGIRLLYGSYNTISQNEITQSYSYGFWIEDSSENLISQNSITDAVGMGVSVGRYSHRNTFLLNEIQYDPNSIDPEFIGIYVDVDTSENNVTLNYILYDSQGTQYSATILDDCTDSWGTIIDRNWYQDYSGYDNNGDGYGDDPYDIPGIAGNSDPRPLTYPPFAPTWVEPPTDQVIDYWSQPFYYDLNATAPTVMTWAVNDTIKFAIDSNGILQSIADLPVGSYGIGVKVTNLYGVYITSLFQLTVQEISPPEWISGPIDLGINFGEGFDYGLIAMDQSGIAEWAINDTVNFALSVTWLNVTGYYNGWHLLHITNETTLMSGMYSLNVTVADPYSNKLTGIFTITVEPPDQDVTAPIWIVSPMNEVLEYGESFEQRLGAWDSSGVSIWWLNDTTHFAIDENGVVRNVTLVEPGVYRLEVRAYDPYDNYCSGTLVVTVNEAIYSPTTPTGPTTTPPTDTTIPTSPSPEEIMGPVAILMLLAGISGAALIVTIIVLLRRSS